MTTAIAVSKTLSIRDCGYDEDWLQAKIAADPSILGLGDLEFVGREKKQSVGRVDVLLRDKDDEKMYQVEVMLGEIDADHIIRAIEYWDRETRYRPHHKHFAVLVAEGVGRFANVLHVLCRYIPMIVIQGNMIELGGARSLYFAEILDAYEEPVDEGIPPEPCDESWWRARAASTLETAKALMKIVSPVYGGMELGYTRSYIALRKEADFFNQFSLKRRGIESTASFCVNGADVDSVSGALGHKDLAFTREEGSKGKTEFAVVLDQARLERNADLFRGLADFVKKCRKP